MVDSWWSFNQGAEGDFQSGIMGGLFVERLYPFGSMNRSIMYYKHHCIKNPTGRNEYHVHQISARSSHS